MLAKVVGVGVRALISFIGADQLTRFGVSINETVLVTGIMAILEGLRNTLKQKYADKLGVFKFLLS
jgi:hypothetical protein